LADTTNSHHPLHPPPPKKKERIFGAGACNNNNDQCLPPSFMSFGEEIKKRGNLLRQQMYLMVVTGEAYTAFILSSNQSQCLSFQVFPSLGETRMLKTRICPE
jgi:hypothetical protein